MRHLRSMSKLGRNCGHRKALLTNLACSILEHGQVETTLDRAKAARKIVDRLITYAKKGGDVNRRLAAAKMKINTPVDKVQGKKPILEKLFTEIAANYAKRPGGYTRIIHTGHRIGDGACTCIIQLVEAGDPAKKAEPATIEAKAEVKSEEAPKA